ncbi:hypothetical protein [Rhodobacter capsulatus]|uniref:hypothetical protein n=1 Tax=Rhodobacter capsulatus TaxID=1061 RepID=UPI0040266BA8
MEPRRHGDDGGHSLSVAADQILPTDAENLPLAPVPVETLNLDLRHPARCPTCPGRSQFLPLGQGVRPVARLTGAKGVSLDLHSDAPGLQVYDGRALTSAPFPG